VRPPDAYRRGGAGELSTAHRALAPSRDKLIEAERLEQKALEVALGR
jgi:hypothetical protein